MGRCIVPRNNNPDVTGSAILSSPMPVQDRIPQSREVPPPEEAQEPVTIWTVFWAALIVGTPLAFCCYLLVNR